MHACMHVYACICMHAYHAYSARMHTYNTHARARAQKPETLDQNQAQTTDGGHEAPPAPPEVGLLWSGLDFGRVSRVFARAGACACIVCMHACDVCILCMHAYHAYSERRHTYNTHARACACKNPKHSTKIKPRPQKPRLRWGWGGASRPPSVVRT